MRCSESPLFSRVREAASCWVVCVTLGFPAFAGAQADSQKIADAARALQPEFGADILFALQPGRERLEELFALAARVGTATAQQDVVGWTDTRSWASARAAGLKLDALSIRCRAARLMIPIDPARARELFLSIALPPFPQISCESTLVPDTAIYWETAGDLGELGSPIRSLSSVLQLASAAKAIRTARIGADERTALLNLFTARMATLTDSPRATAFTLGRLKLSDELIRLPNPDSVLAAYRTFLRNAAAGEQCADADLQSAINEFNGRLRIGGYLAANDLPKLTLEEAKPLAGGAKAKVEPYWRTAQAKRMLAAIRHLRFGDGSAPLSAEQKAVNAWKVEAREFLTNLEAWSDSDESSAIDSFHEKGILYTSYLDLADHDLRDPAAQSYVQFLAQSEVRATNPTEWLLDLKTLFAMKDQDSIQQAIRGSKDPVIAAYARLTYRI